MHRYNMRKESAVPMWLHVPGTPITLPGEQTKYERLPGMTDWAPRDVVSRVGRGLRENREVRDIAEQEANQGLGSNAARGGAGGLLGGAMIARIVGGEKSVAPFKKILAKGINKNTLRGLSRLPWAAKWLPLLGAGLGTAAGVGSWATGRDKRREQAAAVGKGLLSEQILQQHQINQARTARKMPLESATERATKATTVNSTGV